MSKRGRFITYGSAVALALAGAACLAFVSGVTGQVLAVALMGSGLVILTGLVFMEVGLSEDRERENELGRRAEGDRPPPAPPRPRIDPPRPPRLRGPRHER